SSDNPTDRGFATSSPLSASAAVSATGPARTAARPQNEDLRKNASNAKSAPSPKTTYEPTPRESCASASRRSSRASAASGSASGREVSGGCSPGSSAFTVGATS